MVDIYRTSFWFSWVYFTNFKPICNRGAPGTTLLLAKNFLAKLGKGLSYPKLGNLVILWTANNKPVV
jgi:hypothetical protein